MIQALSNRIALALLGSALLCTHISLAHADFSAEQQAAADQTIAQALEEHRSHLRVEDRGEVIKLLPDDTEGDRHQRFIVQLANGQRLLFAYNIDIAPRIDALRRGDSIVFRGEYIWNRKGGIVHWTHHDPSGRHPGGYIQLDGHVYQ